MKIVCATDFSSYARAAAHVAAALAQRVSDTILLYNVLDYADFGEVAGRVIEAFEAQARSFLSVEAERLRAKGVSVVTDLLNGLPDEKAERQREPEESAGSIKDNELLNP